MKNIVGVFMQKAQILYYVYHKRDEAMRSRGNNDGRNKNLSLRWDKNYFFKVSPHKVSRYPYTLVAMLALHSIQA
jgi:hypothetical protein